MDAEQMDAEKSDAEQSGAEQTLADELRQAVEAPPTRVIVIGGGMAGLVAARDCARPGFSVTLLEAGDRVGGSVASLEIDGLTVDAGAESYATRGGHVRELVDELGLGRGVVTPNPAGAWVRFGSQSVPLPKAGLLGIPSSPLASDVVRAIGWAGAWRAYLDRVMPVLKIGTERSLGTLVRKRMGAKVLERLVAPVATGVYSARPDDLDIDVVAPGLNSALTRLGSLSGAVGELRSNAKAGGAVEGIRGGMWRLPAALAADIAERGGVVRTQAAVAELLPFVAPEETDDAVADGATESVLDGAAEGDVAAAQADDARWVVRLTDGEELLADAVVVAVPASAALDLLGEAAAELTTLGDLDWPPASSVELTTLVITDERLAAAPRGTGVLVSDSGTPDVGAKATTHSTAKWSWLAHDAGPGRQVIRLSYGRAGMPSATSGMSDDELRTTAIADASALYGIPLAESAVAGFARTSWTNALPYAALGEGDRIRQVRDAVAAVEGLEVTGSWLTGTGLASVIPDARETATRVRGLRWRTLTENL